MRICCGCGVLSDNFVTTCRGELFASVGSVKGDNETCEFLYESSGTDDPEKAKKSKITDPKKVKPSGIFFINQ